MIWRDIESAPRDGTQFLAALSNGWVVIMSEVPKWDRYAWYQTSSTVIDVPVARTHRPETLTESILATHWQPLPDPPEPTEGRA